MTRSMPTRNDAEVLLNNRSEPWALVTGASGGVGGSCARALADAGYATIVVGRNADRLRALAEEVNAGSGHARCVPIEANLVDREDLRRLLARLEAMRAPDVFVSAAGMTSNSTVHFADDHLDELLALNVRVPMHLSRGVITLMEKERRGYIINVASRAGLVGFSDKGIYGASKAATVRFFDALYTKYLDSDIRVTSICPGWINTPMAVAGGCRKQPEEMLQPEDIAAATVWLLSLPSRVRIRELVVEAGGTTAST